MKTHEIIPSLNVENLIKHLIAKQNPSNYPKNSISLRESICKFEFEDIKKAEKICNELNNEITNTIMKFSDKHKLRQIKDK